MKIYTIILLLITQSLFTSGCNPSESAIQVPAIEMFGFIYNDNQIIWGEIDQQTHTITVKNISTDNVIQGVKYTLTPNSTLSPLPESLIGKLNPHTTFTVRNNKEEVTYILLLPDWNKEDSELAPNPEEWSLYWSDEFNADTFNPTIWSKIPKGNPDWQNDMAPYNELFELKNGTLSLWGRRNTDYPEFSSNVLTGGLWTKELKSFSAGRFDIRARFDCAQGFWPALWLRPQHNTTNDKTEIDILEHINFEDIAHQTVHSDYTMNIDKIELSNTVKTAIDKSTWHVYSVEIHTDRVIFLIDNKETYVYPKLYPAVAGQFPFPEKEYYLILSAQLGGKWAGNVNINQLPVRLEVDYIRYYKKKK